MVENLPIECLCSTGQSREHCRRLLGHSRRLQVDDYPNIQRGSHIAYRFQQFTFLQLSLSEIIDGQRPGAFTVSLESLNCENGICKYQKSVVLESLMWSWAFGLLRFWMITLSVFVFVVAYLFSELQSIVRSVGSWTKQHGIKCQLCHFLAVYSWANYLIFLCLSFCMRKMWTTVRPS